MQRGVLLGCTDECLARLVCCFCVCQMDAPLISKLNVQREARLARVRQERAARREQWHALSTALPGISEDNQFRVLPEELIDEP